MTLKEFFVDEYVSIPFKLFGKTHIFLLFFICVNIFLIVKFKKRIFDLELDKKKKVMNIFAIILLFNMLLLYLSSLAFKCFDYKNMLPFHLCYIANYLYIFAILFRKYNYFKYSYLLSFMGPVPAIIFFDVPSVWESYNFYLYIFSHHFLLIFTLFTFYMVPQIISKKDIIKLFGVLNVLFLFFNLFNRIFNTNYWFSQNIPNFILDLLPFLKNIPLIFILELVEILILLLLAIFYNRQFRKLSKYCI